MAMPNRNEEFFSVVDSDTMAAILTAIAGHHGISSEEAFAEVTDAEAEHLPDYMVEPQRTATSLLMQRHCMRNPAGLNELLPGSPGYNVTEMVVRPDFKNMDRVQLSEWYIENVGYDIGAEDPSMSLESYRELCAELYELHHQASE